MDSEFALRLMGITAFHHTDDLWWRYRRGGSAPADDADTLAFYVPCNDLFWWGCADLEEVTPENIEQLAQAYVDCEKHGAELFCSRVRAMRIQGGWFAKGYFDATWLDLFAACGPEREVGLGNPYPFMSKADYEATQPVA